MVRRYDTVDLSALPPPAVVEALDVEVIFAALVADYRARYPDFSALVESEPVVKLLEVAAYREATLRARVNDAARAVMLATATGADLDNLAALLHVARQVVDPGDPDGSPPVAPTYETDARLRARVQLAMEGLSVAGPSGAYVFHSLGASPLVADVAVASPAPGDVVVTILSSAGDGVPDADLLATVAAALNDDDTRPLTDRVTVQAANRIAYTVTASIEVYDGPDANVVRQASEDATLAFVLGQRRLGEPVTIDGLHKALRVAGVRQVFLVEPAAAIDPDEASFADCETLTVTLA